MNVSPAPTVLLRINMTEWLRWKDMETYSITFVPSILKAEHSVYSLRASSRAETPESPHVQRSKGLEVA